MKYYQFQCGCVLSEEKNQGEYKWHCLVGCANHPYNTHKDAIGIYSIGDDGKNRINFAKEIDKFTASIEKLQYGV